MSNTDSIRLMTIEDIEEVCAIELLSFATPWTKESFQQELLTNKLARYLVLVRDGHIVAYAGIWLVLREGHITNVAVHPQYRGLGLGRRIVAEILKLACCFGVEEATLEVRPSNEAAIALYRSFNFQENGLRKGYYTDTNEDALIMWKYDVAETPVSEEECRDVYGLCYE